MKTVQEYQLIIAKTQEKILKVQNKCKHASFTPKMYSWRTGAFSPSLICDACSKVLEGITPEQTEKVWREWNAVKQEVEYVRIEN